MSMALSAVRLRRTLAWVQSALFTCAVLLLGYCGIVLAEAWKFQRHEQRQFDLQLAARDVGTPVLKEFPAVAQGGLIGRIAIPRLGVNVMVVEGAGASSLRHAAGHISGTALPGQPGNIAISAHRDTFFRPLRDIRKDDLIALTSLHGEDRYRVVSTAIVDPSAVEVLAPTETDSLTLVTCYPFNFLGPAPQRFIVRAERVTGPS